MINWFTHKLEKKLIGIIYASNLRLTKLVNDYRKENQALSGRIKILEEQQEIMHNFLVEINKYLADKL